MQINENYHYLDRFSFFIINKAEIKLRVRNHYCYWTEEKITYFPDVETWGMQVAASGHLA